MGCDIHSFAEVKTEGKWKRIEDKIFPDWNDFTTEPFGCRSYSLFGFLAGVRNYSESEVIIEPRGLPLDSEYLNSPTDYPEIRSYWTEEPVKVETNLDDISSDMNYHTHSHIYLNELLAFDYNKYFEDKRITVQTGPNSFNGAGKAKEGEGNIITYKEHLGESYFKDLEILKSLGNPEDVRIVFYFDN